ncbi:carboxypeptidase Y-deficient [Dispira parvispora]|uniref:Carboxypeptidase Y-deficient n=1 Tax=Dispira parvispora TaxID=1520584 RepID=A0A9W8E2I3_9FUNG|nr:carboxypeptidase Y-deficient [Dispira parvispora]
MEQGNPALPPRRPPQSGPASARPVSSSSCPFVCPVCGAAQPSLEQLNRHLDTSHFGVPNSTGPHTSEAPYNNDDDSASTSSTDALVNFFRTAQRKLLDPLSKLGTSLATGSNGSLLGDDVGALLLDISGSDMDTQLTDTPEHPMVTRVHWKPNSPNDLCDDPRCSKPLNVVNGRQHCRKCGKIFCHEHCQLFIRLAFNAVHDPVHGAWSRVCETCYVSRSGYQDIQGPTRSWTTQFLEQRKATVKRILLEENKLRNRLDKLSQLPSHPPTTAQPSILLGKNSRKQVEQSVVKWEADELATQCHGCQQPFTGILSRKHHCRLCGKVTCSRPECSSMFPITSKTGHKEETVPTRVCKRCMGILSRRTFIISAVRTKTPTLTAYQNLVRYRGNIEKLLPKFDQLVLKISQETSQVTEGHVDYQVAAKLRKDLLDNFSQFDRVSKQIPRLKNDTQGDQRLHAAIYQYCTHYLQHRMFSLSLLPRLLKRGQPTSTPGSQSSNKIPSPSPRSNSSLHASDITGVPKPPSSQSSNRPPSQASTVENQSTPSSTGITGGFFGLFGRNSPSKPDNTTNKTPPQLTKAELNRQLDTLEVLQEQRKLVETYLQDAIKHRKLEDAKSLRVSLAELDEEITNLQNALEPSE